MKNTRKLLLVRHAQAQDKVQGDTDFNRELSAAGLREATYLGELLKSWKLIPDSIVSSAAIRAAGTATILREKLLGDNKEVILKKELYEASVRTLLHNVNVLKNEWKTVLLVAHNPGIHYFAEYITGAVIDGIEPCALVEVTFEAEQWSLVSQGSGTFDQYVPPFRLEKEGEE